MLTVPESVDPTLLHQLRQHILAKYGQAMLDAISPRREPGPATLPPIVIIAMGDRTAHVFGDAESWREWVATKPKIEVAWAIETAIYHPGKGDPAPCPDTDEWRPKG